MKRTFFAVGLTTLLLVATLAAAACGGDDDADGQDMGGMADGSAPAGSIEVKLINWAVEPAKTSAPAGKVTFWAVHDEAHGHDAAEGGVTHDLQVMKKKADGSFAPRVGWTNFTQQALKDLVKEQPKAKVFIEPFLDE